MENISNVSKIIDIFIKEIRIVWYQIDNNSCIDNDTQSSLSPILSEDIVNKALVEQDMDIQNNVKTVNNMRCADDTVLLARTDEDLQTVINRIVRVSEE